MRDAEGKPHWQLPPLVSIVLLIMLAGLALLTYVRHEDQAQSKAFKVKTEVSAKLARYAINSNACRARALINKTIRDQQKLLATYIQAAKDESLSQSAKARNAVRISDTQTSIDGLRKFRDLYVTVPPGFDCKTLPAKPPKGFIP